MCLINKLKNMTVNVIIFPFIFTDQTGDSPPEEAMGTFPFNKSSSGSHDEDAIFKERLRNMGKSMLK
jgi:hypothetical protein